MAIRIAFTCALLILTEAHAPAQEHGYLVNRRTNSLPEVNSTDNQQQYKGLRADCNSNGIEDHLEFGPVEGHALLLSGNDEYVTPAQSATLFNLGYGNFTLETWVRTTYQERTTLIGNAADGLPDQNFWNLELRDSVRLAYRHVYSTEYHDSGVSIADGNWHHVAAVRTQDASGRVRIYIDGGLVYDEPASSFGFSAAFATTIARQFMPSYYYAGTLDEMRVWNIAREGADIATDMYRVLEGTETGLVAYWRFEEGTGTTTIDSAANHDGTLVGPPIWIPFSPDCNSNEIPDECENDCNSNGMPDECDISGGTSIDGDGDGIPDECQPIRNTSQGTVHDTIQDAINSAIGGDVIEVAPGMYVERIDMLGKAITLRSTGGPEVTIIDGDAGGNVIRCTNGEGPGTIIQGFKITNGNALHGAGMYNNDSSPTVTDCIFADNLPGNTGCGMGNSRSNPTLTNCIFSRNSVNYRGGGMYNHTSSPTLVNCTFNENSSTGEYGSGGGIYNDQNSNPTLTNCTFNENSSSVDGGGMGNDSSNPIMIDCTFTENTASRHGGGVHNSNSNPTLTQCTFTRNSSSGSYATGGGMYNENSNPALTDCVFDENHAEFFGGGFSGSNCQATLINCTFRKNSAVNGGGGMYNASSTPTLTNCVFIGNTTNSSRGGGICNSSSNPTLINCTISGNSAEYGGGISNYSNCSPTLTNCILWGNIGTLSDPQIHDGSSTSLTTATYSCIQGGWAGVGNIHADPLLTDADGPDDIFGTPDDDVHLQSGSPCINAGDNSAIPISVITDYEGDDRIQLCVVDMGVDETPYGKTLDCNTNGIPDMCDIAFGTSADCNMNEIPDDCEPGWLADCNLNGIQDWCDITNGTSPDCNANSIPDDCESMPVGVLYVDGDAVAGLGNGSSWDNAYTNLADALAHVQCSGAIGEIYVAGGTYTPDSTGLSDTRKATFTLIDDLALFGGYAGVGAPNADERNIELHETILSGDLNGNDIITNGPDTNNNGDNCYHVITSVDEYCTAVLDGFTIIGGNANGPEQDNHTKGGGMYNNEGDLTVINCTFRGNSAEYGGAIYNIGAYDTTVTNCTFSRNSSQEYGGAVCNDNCSPILTNCAFTANTTNYGGGGMCNEHDSNPTLTNCTFGRNTSQEYGGGVYNYNGSSPILINCTFNENTAEYGGGICSEFGSNPTLKNCILWGNTAITGSQVYDDGGTTTAAFSCIQDGWPGTGNINSDPLFVSTSGIDLDLQLQQGSPCIDAGSNGSLPPDTYDLDHDNNTVEPIPFDLSGLQRFWDDPGTIDTGSGNPPIVDMGAYEYQFLPGDCDNDGDVDLDDLDNFVNCLSGPGTSPPQGCTCADIDYDDDVDLFDYHLFLQQHAKSIADSADLDGNGKVDLRDFAMFQEQFGTLVSCPADLNGDGEVDTADYILFQMQLGGPK